MFSTVLSGALHGISCFLTNVEVDTAAGLPGFDMVGFLSGEVREARERVRVALRNSGIFIPAMRITVNLSPADIRKDGTAFDLPIALGILQSLGHIAEERLARTLAVGELGLDGEVKFVRGILPIVLEAQEKGCRRCLIPMENAEEGRLAEGMEVVGVSNLREVIAYLTGEPESGNGRAGGSKRVRQEESVKSVGEGHRILPAGMEGDVFDFADVNGQEGARRAAEVAAAGFHHLLLIGPPGSGKSMIAQRIPTILPPLSEAERLEVSKIYSVAGLLRAGQLLMEQRPFLHPHPSITKQAFAGGGRIPVPGVLSLAHRGILYLDETPDFGRDILDMMRQPLEEKTIQIARSGGSFSYPTNFMLICSMNPCPCGYYPDMQRCRCAPHEVQRYLGKISGPILDRIDICAEASRVPITDLTGGRQNESSEVIRKRVLQARKLQQERYQGTVFRTNADLNAAAVRKFCTLGKKEQSFLERVFQTMDMSVRAYHRILKVSRTIADLDGSEKIKEIHLSEAVCYRSTRLTEIMHLS